MRSQGIQIGILIRIRSYLYKVPILKALFLVAAFMLSFLLAILSPRCATASRDQALSFLDHVMDQYHSSFIVFKEANSGGNHFIPSGWMGDIGDLEYSSYDTSNPRSGLTSIRIDYSAKGTNGWAGIYWQAPANNWGTMDGGFDLSGYKSLTFWAKGQSGGDVGLYASLAMDADKTCSAEFERISESKIGDVHGDIVDALFIARKAVGLEISAVEG